MLKRKAIGAKLAAFWPNQADRGVHMNVSGAGVTKHARNVENAVKLMEFMASDQSQAWYAEVNNEYPVVTTAKVSDTLAGLGEIYC